MDENAEAAAENPNEVFLFKAGTTLFALVEWARNVSPALLKRARRWGPDGHSYLVPILLHEDLFLLVRKPGRVELKGCKCSALLPTEQDLSLIHI